MAVQFTPRLEKAIRVAATAHRHQTRKSVVTPYITHPFSVMTVASSVTDDEDTLIACLFHDILEDVPEEYSEADMRREYGDRVTDIVLGVTQPTEYGSWRERNEGYLANLRKASDESAIVSGSDKIHNLISTLNDYETVGDEIWQRFTTKSDDDQSWWYESVLAVLKERQAPTALIEKLDSLVGQLRTIVKG